MPIFRRTNCIITGSGIVTLYKRLYSMPDDSSLLSSGILYSRLQRVTIPDPVIIQFDLLLSTSVLYSHLQRVMIPDAVIIQFVLLKMDMLMLKTC